MPRWVTGIPAAAGTAAIEETPGTISQATPAACRASASSPPRPKTNGSPPFSRTTSRPSWPESTSSSVTAAWSSPSRQRTSAPDGRFGDELGSDEPVVDEHVAGTDELEAAGRDQARIAGPGADEVDGHPSSSRTMPAK